MIEVRPMQLSDIDAVSAIRVSGWRAAYAGIVPQSYLDAMSVEEDAARCREWFKAAGNQVENLVATDAGTVTGWAATGPRAGDPGGGATGELYALYVRPDRKGTGLGRRLMEAVRSFADERGFRRLELWVLADNARARRFYEHAGFSPDGAERVEEYGGVPLRDVRYAGQVHLSA
ncbi:GNAT family N-acetyltransferase [Streptomyces sp. NPDC093984]|uniref:GNAT family N-acetyltransferase n=1 Tax=Streptomyces sp. NPDC093984 TaxID=3366052 RepID=UPI00380CFEEC